MVTKLVSKIKEYYQKNKYEVQLSGFLIGTAIIIILLIRFLPQPAPTDNTRVIPPVQKIYIKGEPYAVVNQEEISKRDHIIDSLSKALKVKPKQIKGVDRIVTRIDTVLVDGVITEESSDSIVITKEDAHVFIQAVKRKSDSAYINFRLTPDTMDIVSVHKDPLFGRGYTKLMIHHTNKYFETTHGSSYRVQDRKVLFNITGSAGYNFINKQVYIGVGITPEFLRIPIYRRQK